MLLCMCLRLHHVGVGREELALCGNFLQLPTQTEFLVFFLLFFFVDFCSYLLDGSIAEALLRFLICLFFSPLGLMTLLRLFPRPVSDSCQSLRLLSNRPLLFVFFLDLALLFVLELFCCARLHNLEALPKLRMGHFLQQTIGWCFSWVELFETFDGHPLQSSDLANEVALALHLLLFFQAPPLRFCLFFLSELLGALRPCFLSPQLGLTGPVPIFLGLLHELFLFLQSPLLLEGSFCHLRGHFVTLMCCHDSSSTLFVFKGLYRILAG
mmetsp:Transcript_22876/g.66056  ORF Transcript_22876/g.66056 Transcript_22876/m.66056 type:complete len:268 (-) Transcript_22876:1206-2009(-)